MRQTKNTIERKRQMSERMTHKQFIKLANQVAEESGILLTTLDERRCYNNVFKGWNIALDGEGQDILDAIKDYFTN